MDELAKVRELVERLGSETGGRVKFLSREEVKKLLRNTNSFRTKRHRQRAKLAFLLAYRHGLRVSELLSIRWSDVNFERSDLYIRRLKGGIDGTHILRADELRLLRSERKLAPHAVFVVQGEPPERLEVTYPASTPRKPSLFRGLLSSIARCGYFTAISLRCK